MTLERDYNKVHSVSNLKLSMPGYVKVLLIEFNHEYIKQQFKASPYKEPTYGTKVQYVEFIDIPTFTKKQFNSLQWTCGKFLYYAQAINNIVIHALNDWTSQVIAGTMKTKEIHSCFLNYYMYKTDPSIIYYASEIMSSGDSNASYLVPSKA